jgi:soluble lytic murein transglycosylase
MTSAARRAGAWLDLVKAQGMRVRPLAADELLPRAESERHSAQITRARQTYAQVLKQSRGRRQTNLRHIAELGLAEIDLIDRRYQRALDRVEGVRDESAEPEIVAQAIYLRGDVLSRTGRVEEALLDYESVLGGMAATAFAPEAALSAARLAYGTRRFDRAREYARWLLERPATATGQVAVIGGDGALQHGRAAREGRDHALWLLAWIERRGGAAPEVLDSLLSQIDAGSELAESALYWRARLAVDNHRLADAEIFADLLTARAPTSFYALAASDLLRRVNPTCSVRLDLPEPSPAPTTPPAGEPRDLKAAMVLFEHGLVSEARRLAQMMPVGQLNAADRVAVAWLYRRCGDVTKSASLARRPANGSAALSDRVLLELAYPRPFEEEVLAAAGAHGVPVQLIYAVMRQESAFNPRAMSPRQARGLMQMIRSTALRMAEEAELEGFKPWHLFEPEVSIDLGAQYLAGLIAHFDGNVVAAVAAYHAGERNVGRWIATRGSFEMDEFIEEIPYATTRDYVKKVLSSYGVYRLLYDEETRVALPALARSAATTAPPNEVAAR